MSLFFIFKNLSPTLLLQVLYTQDKVPGTSGTYVRSTCYKKLEKIRVEGNTFILHAWRDRIPHV